MGVRFCLISVLKQWHLFHFFDTHFFLSGPGLWPPCLEAVAHLSLEQKLQWKFWCKEVLRRGLNSHPPPHPGSPEGDGRGVPLLGLWRAQCTEGRPTNPLILVHGPQTGGSVLTYALTTPETSGVHRSHRTLAKLLGSVVPCKAGQTAGVGERLAFHWDGRNSAALLWKLVQWRYCASSCQH